jgi:alkanesulfonate monooxygenase SsuD/methylene tetrahydromethanopterin reductase-like flavin-dependent oxidoreductase (luciferase family)
MYPQYPYPTPGQNEQRIRQRSMQMNPEGGAELAQNTVNAQAQRYAQMRMQQMQRLAAAMGNAPGAADFNTQMSATQGLDPAQAWRFISSHFAKLANQQGFQDPRMFLHQALRGGVPFQQPQQQPMPGTQGPY